MRGRNNFKASKLKFRRHFLAPGWRSRQPETEARPEVFLGRTLIPGARTRVCASLIWCPSCAILRASANYLAPTNELQIYANFFKLRPQAFAGGAFPQARRPSHAGAASKSKCAPALAPLLDPAESLRGGGGRGRPTFSDFSIETNCSQRVQLSCTKLDAAAAAST